jgi:hypothetical protein
MGGPVHKGDRQPATHLEISNFKLLPIFQIRILFN